MKNFQENRWVDLAVKEGPAITKLFDEAEQAGLRTMRARKLLFGATWRMGLIRMLRAYIPEKDFYELFANQPEPRYWFGSWKIWKVARRAWEFYFHTDLAKALPFAKFCLAHEELQRACVDNPGRHPDARPLTEEEVDQVILVAAESVRRGDKGDYHGLYKMERIVRASFQRWLDHRTLLGAEEKIWAEEWLNVVGRIDDIDLLLAPADSWAQFLLDNFQRKRV